MANRRRPDIRAANEYLTRVEYLKCAKPECRNVIAAWARQRFCSRCGARKVRR